MRKTNLTALSCIVASLLAANVRATHAQTVALQDTTTQDYTTQEHLAPGAKIILVDDDRKQYRNAPYSHINNAIYAANPGDVIRVAPGIYHEAVVINKNVRLEGAQAGRSASQGNRLKNFSPSQETIIVLGQNLLALDPLPYAIVTVRSANITMDGFTIQGEGTSQRRVGIGVDTAAAGFTLLNTRIEQANTGVSLTTQTSGLLQGNAFLNNQDFTGVDDTLPTPAVTTTLGQGIAGTSDLSNVSISSNTFAGNQTTGIALGLVGTVPAGETLPTGGSHISNINISSNRFDDTLGSNSSGAGIVLQNADDVTLQKNTIRGGSDVGIGLDSEIVQQSQTQAQTTPAVATRTTISQNSITGVAGDGMFMSNSLLDAIIDHNTISGNQGNGIVLSQVSAYVNAFNLFSNNKIANNGSVGFLVSASIGNHLENNLISGNANGVVVDYSQDNQIKNNTIRNSLSDGIFATASASGNIFGRNLVQSSSRFDIEDISTGNNTAGTANIYRNNKAKKANPVALASTN